MSGYETRAQEVVVGRTRASVLVAAFALPSGGEVLFQLADEGDLRAGGVYLLPPGSGTSAHAPRFDEIFRDAAAKGRDARLARSLSRLVERARAVARATRPRLTAATLRRLVQLATAAARAGEGLSVPGLPLDALTLLVALVFASEEARYPRPRYKGCDVAAGRLQELLAHGEASSD